MSPAGGSLGGSRGEVGRFVLSDRRGSAPRFLFSHLFPPHGRRERWLRLAAGRSARVARRAVAPAGDEARIAGEALERVLETSGAGPWREWILVRPHDDDRRGRLTAFLFPPGSDLPHRVLKLRRPDGEGGDLAGEARTLERLRSELPESLTGSVPAVLRYSGADEAAGWEALLLARLPGRPGYVELQGSLDPARVVARHFRAAGAWLARFHRATLRPEDPWRPPPWGELAPEPEDPRPEWHRRLEAELEEAPCIQAAGHGDFWVRNLLLAPGGAETELPGVVDWEHHRPAAAPFEDLFHFAWSYAQAYPWRGRRRPTGEAFERAFLRDTVVARQLRRYLAEYARETGLDAGSLGDLFRVYLLMRPRTGGGAWTGLYRRLERAERCVFSG